MKDEEKVLSEEGRALRDGAPEEEIRVKRKEADKAHLLRRGGESGRKVVRGRAEEEKVKNGVQICDATFNGFCRPRLCLTRPPWT